MVPRWVTPPVVVGGVRDLRAVADPVAGRELDGRGLAVGRLERRVDFHRGAAGSEQHGVVPVLAARVEQLVVPGVLDVEQPRMERFLVGSEELRGSASDAGGLRIAERSEGAGGDAVVQTPAEGVLHHQGAVLRQHVERGVQLLVLVGGGGAQPPQDGVAHLLVQVHGPNRTASLPLGCAGAGPCVRRRGRPATPAVRWQRPGARPARRRGSAFLPRAASLRPAPAPWRRLGPSGRSR